jgi:hypothetical protein
MSVPYLQPKKYLLNINKRINPTPSMSYTLLALFDVVAKNDPQ